MSVANQSRMEMLGSLLAAMALVALTGNLPAEFDTPTPVDVNGADEEVVPLMQQFPELLRYKSQRYDRLKWLPPFHPRKFLVDTFGLHWTVEADYFLALDVMPSHFIRDLAISMAKGDLDLAQRIADSRSTKGIRAAQAETGHGDCLAAALWRYNGNPDTIWESLRKEMQRCSDERAAQGLTLHNRGGVQ